jgi:hypothetical protein
MLRIEVELLVKHLDRWLVAELDGTKLIRRKVVDGEANARALAEKWGAE